MNWRLSRGHEARTHVHCRGTESESGDQASAIGDAAAGDDGYAQATGRRWNQHQSWHIVLSRMSSVFESIDADCGDTELLSL